MKKVLIGLAVFLLGCTTIKPKIDCWDINDIGADTTYFVFSEGYEGFLFHDITEFQVVPPNQVIKASVEQIHRAESILAQTNVYNKKYKRQYIGYTNSQSDTLVYIRLLRKGFRREDCFDKILVFGFDGYYEKDQQIHRVNLSTETVTNF